jgi:hypothetical protein
MTIMFADIRSFTSISEKLTPKQTFDFINSYLKGAGPIIRKHDGFIDKYMGDGIMALFETSEAAIAAAVQLQNRNERISRTMHGKMSMPLRVGIGLHTGHLMLGSHTTRNLPDVLACCVFAASQNVSGATRGGRAKCTSFLSRSPRSLLRNPEHPRSYGTAGSAACKFC